MMTKKDIEKLMAGCEEIAKDNAENADLVNFLVSVNYALNLAWFYLDLGTLPTIGQRKA
jgi:hypothetical protein